MTAPQGRQESGKKQPTTQTTKTNESDVQCSRHRSSFVVAFINNNKKIKKPRKKKASSKELT